jgi:hypothetical protein
MDPCVVHGNDNSDVDGTHKDAVMSQPTTDSVYDRTYHHYLKQLKERPFDGKEEVLGITVEGDAVTVPYFGQPIRLTTDGLADEKGQRPDFSDCVVVCRYLIMAPPFEPRQKEWVAYRDFPDAGPLTVFWRDTVEGQLAQTFSGQLNKLKAACDVLGRTLPETEIACDQCCCFTPLPKVPLLLVFNDSDEDFPATATLLFEKRADSYLDAESQAILGHALTRRLLAAVSG